MKQFCTYNDSDQLEFLDLFNRMLEMRFEARSICANPRCTWNYSNSSAIKDYILLCAVRTNRFFFYLFFKPERKLINCDQKSNLSIEKKTSHRSHELEIRTKKK